MSSSRICINRITQIETINITFGIREPICRNNIFSFQCPDNVTDVQMIDYQTFIGIKHEHKDSSGDYPEIESHVIVFNRFGNILHRFLISPETFGSATILKVYSIQIANGYIAISWILNQEDIDQNQDYYIGNIYKPIYKNNSNKIDYWDEFCKIKVNSLDNNTSEYPRISKPYIHTNGSVSILAGIPREDTDKKDAVFFARLNADGEVEVEKTMVLEDIKEATNFYNLQNKSWTPRFQEPSMYGERLWCSYDRFAVGMGKTIYNLRYIEGHGGYTDSSGGIQVVDVYSGEFIVCAPNIDIWYGSFESNDDYIYKAIHLGRLGFVDNYLDKYTVAIMSVYNDDYCSDPDCTDRLETGIVIYDTSKLRFNNDNHQSYDQKFAIAHTSLPADCFEKPNRLKFGQQMIMYGNLIIVAGSFDNGRLYIYRVDTEDGEPKYIDFLCEITPEYFTDVNIKTFANNISVENSVVCIDSTDENDKNIITLVDLKCLFIQNNIFAGIKEIELIENGE